MSSYLQLVQQYFLLAPLLDLVGEICEVRSPGCVHVGAEDGRHNGPVKGHHRPGQEDDGEGGEGRVSHVAVQPGQGGVT